ncbi:amidohydrolase [Pseudoalteromonas sp. SK18]|uniref:amidohydrolase family protein n=1 Tax=Pseudoalteromonas sp. SK18 TaxID=1938366 RepID=UPI0009786B5C|nr:amidohydrolase family protein [Pseudoalteromonas sp. SK18]
MSTKIIDPHLHFFNLLEGQYTWLQGANPPAWPNLDKIKQPISVAKLIKNTDFELVGLVHIEAGFDNNQPVKELNWLANHIKTIPYKAISFATINQPNNAFKLALQQLEHCSLVGIRDITEGHDAERLLSPHCLDNLRHLSQLKLHFEAQFEVENLNITERLISYANQVSDLQIIINHTGLAHNLANWTAAIELLAKQPNVAIKFSGFELLMLNSEQQSQCFKHILKHFGMQRVMFASNFPVCQININYNELWQHYRTLCDDTIIWQHLSYKNAARLYQL